MPALSPPSVLDDTIMEALRTLLVAIVGPDVEVVQAQANRVPEPVAEDFILATPVNRNRLATNVETWAAGADPVTLDHSASTEVTVQLDIHGPNGADHAQAIVILLRSGWAVDQLAGTGVTPLWATDGHQAPFVNAEKQYENRWVTTVGLQVTPTVSTPQDFADTVQATLNRVNGG